MATVNLLSPPPPSDDPDDFTQIREMYKRYMLNHSVARWLLSRDVPTDFHAVRKENSVMLSVNSASPPRVIPQHAPDVPFPASSDLMFLDHVQDGFALGHIWGNPQSDTHPYAKLAIRAGKSGWDHVHTRKFACDLTVSGTLETVEYTWFTDNRAMVILSQIPFQPGTRVVRTSEVLFFDSVERTDIPPQRPALVLLLHDRSMCTTCKKEICCCSSTIGIERATQPTCRLTQESTLTSDRSVVSPTLVQSWEDRARVVSHGTKRGLLSIVYSGTFTGNLSQITVRQAYVSTCEDQSAIEYRIEQHLTKLLSRIPPTPSTMIAKPASAIPAAPHFNSTQECDITMAQEGSQSPMSFTPKVGHWFDSPRETIFPPSQEKHSNISNRGKQNCRSSPTETVKLNISCVPAPGASCNQKMDPDAAAGCTTSSKCSREEHVSDKGSTSAAAEILPASAAPQDARSDQQDRFQVSLCGPEKAGKDCNCSAEKMQNASLARILNSGNDEVVSHGMEDMATFMDPMLASSPHGNNNLLQPAPKISPTALIANMSTQEQGRVDHLSRGPQTYDNQSPNSTRCGTSTTIPSPLPPPPPPSLQVEPALKRPRTDSPMKPESFGFGLEAGWHGGLEDRDKFLPSPAWGGVGGNIERPLSALSRAFGVARSHSPFALMSTLAKTPSPPAPGVGGQGVTFGRTVEFDLRNTFDPLPIPSLAELSKNADDRVNVASQTNFVSGTQKKSSAGSSRNTGASIPESAAGSGVCCDICGITFAKRSNKIRHIQTVHNRLKQFECNICGTKFGLKADLGRHKFRIHESRAFRCDSCGKSFAEQGQLEHHVRVTHEEDSRPWECKTCRMRFGRKSSLTRHEQTVHQQTRFVCRFCKKSYSQRFDAVRHERRVHGVHDKAGSAGIKQLTR